MDEMERRLRAAFIEASEPAPSGLLADVYRRHRRHLWRRRRATAGYVATAAALTFAIPPIAHALRSPALPGAPSGGRSMTLGGSPAPRTSRAPAPAPGTVLRTCSDANWGQLQSNWRADSFRAGPVWFVFGRQDGYVHNAGFRPVRHRYRGVKGGVMITEVADGSTITMKPTSRARLYFRFVDGFNGPRPNYLPVGDAGFTLSACPRGAAGPNGPVTDFYLGFLFKAARSAPVDIWTGTSVRPIRVIFTYPGP
jgi:hypothetical protein